MNAVLRDDDPLIAPMRVADLDAVLAIEAEAYEFPWTRGNFVDSLAVGYDGWVLREADGALAAYCVAMPGVGESHLLNLTVAASHRRRGLARRLLDALLHSARTRGHEALWLEVRPSNERARAVYRRYGFAEVGLRRGYYPARGGAREDAVVMKLALLPGAATKAIDGLD